MKYVLVFVLLLFFVFAIGAILYDKFDTFKKFYHDMLMWHKPNGKIRLEGILLMSKCKFCGKDIMQDSQGNWF